MLLGAALAWQRITERPTAIDLSSTARENGPLRWSTGRSQFEGVAVRAASAFREESAWSRSVEAESLSEDRSPTTLEGERAVKQVAADIRPSQYESDSSVESAVASSVESAVASVAASPAETERVGALNESEPIAEPFAGAGAGESDGIVLNFQAAPWDAVLKRLAAEAGFALQISALPPGEFTYLDKRAYTATEAVDLFNGYLYTNGYILVRNQNLLTVISLSSEEPFPYHLLPTASPFELESYGRNELLTIEVPLRTIEPTAAAQEVQGLLSPLGRVVPLPNAERIVVSDFGENLRRLFQTLWLRESDPSSHPQLVFRLKNIPAEQAAKAINEYFATQRQAGQPFNSGGTSRAALAAGQVGPGISAASPGDAVVVAEPETNSVLVGASNRYLERIRAILCELDAIPAQVLIQALLVEVDLGNTNELGVELGAQSSVLFDRSVVDQILTVTETVSNPATGIATTNQAIVSQTANPGFNFNNRPLGNNVAGDPSQLGGQGLSNFSLGRVNGDLGFGGLVLSASSESISVLLRALAAKRKVDVLSRPQIRTLDNKSAEIQIGQQVPVVDGVSLTPVGSANPVIRQDQAGIILTVLPRIGPNDEVVIEVRAEKSEFNTTPGSGVPIFTDATNGNVIEAPIKNLSKVDTVVSVFAGQTVVLGGMITKGHDVFERKVPILGDIPWIGWLFRYDFEQTQRKELLIFLTPHVVRNCQTSDEHTALETARIHFPEADAAQMHGPFPISPEPIQPPGIDFPERAWLHPWRRHNVAAPVTTAVVPDPSLLTIDAVANPILAEDAAANPIPAEDAAVLPQFQQDNPPATPDAGTSAAEPELLPPPSARFSDLAPQNSPQRATESTLVPLPHIE